jgi:hypothetical protein
MKPGIAINKPVKWLTTDFNQFKALHENVVSTYDGQIKQLFAGAKLKEISQLNNQLAQFEASFTNLRYLGDLSD